MLTSGFALRKLEPKLCSDSTILRRRRHPISTDLGMRPLMERVLSRREILKA